MLRPLALCLAAVLAAPAALTQPFPPPGEGIFTWERVTDRRLAAYALAFGPSGLFYAARDTLQLYEHAAGGAALDLDVGRLAPGLYVARVVVGQGAGARAETRRFVVAR